MNPRKAASAVLDRGGFLFAAAMAVAVALAISSAAGAVQSMEYRQVLQAAAPALDSPQFEDIQALHAHARRLVRSRYFATGLNGLLLLAVVFAPFCILVLAAWDHLGGGMTILFRDYMPATVGLLFAWTAAHLPLACVWWSPLMPSPALVVPLQLAGIALFLLLAAPVLSTVTGGKVTHAAVTGVAGAFVSAVASSFFASSGNLLYLFASPWLLYFAYQRFGGDIRSLGGGLAERQAFKRQLELATINPHDADAHYQLGLLYAQRRLPAEAEQRFRQALAIDPNEPEVLFHLGRLLSQQEGRGEEAQVLLEKGAALDPKLSSNEVWRELGALALRSGRLEEALRHLARYTALREYDPEGLVLYGQALRASNRTEEAKAALQSAVEAVRGAPRFRRSEVARWESLARQELRSL